MKKIAITLTVILMWACGGNSGKSVDSLLGSNDLEAIRAKRNELTEQRNALDAQLEQLDSVIADLDKNEKFPLITTFVAKPETFNHYVQLLGDVRTKQNVLIYPEMPGTLVKVYVKEGQKVSKGQLLATIDDGGLSSQLEQIKTQAALAKTTFERQQRLWDQKIGSEIQYLQAKTNYEAAQNSVKQLQSQVDKSSIRAPFAGIIDDVIKDEGTVVAPGAGSEVFRIVNLSNMYIEVEVPENYITDVTKDKDVIVYFPVLGDSVQTKVRETGNFINPNNRSFTAEIAVPNTSGHVKPNLTAQVNINDYTNENALLVPLSIISENSDGEQYLYLAKDIQDGKAKATKTIITTGKSQGNHIEVLSGIAKGDQVILDGSRSVKDNQEVEILKDSVDE